MRASLILLLGILVVNLLLDWYIIRQLKARLGAARKAWLTFEWISVALMLGLLLAAIAVPARSGSNVVLLTKMWLLFSYLTCLVPKLLGVLFDLIASIPTLFSHKRLRVFTVSGIVLGAVAFAAMWWGALLNRYRIDVREVEVEITDLPESFSGYRMVQFSDLHTGTFGSDTTFVAELVDRINSLNPDVILFTGDIVNRESEEMEPFVNTLSRLKARDGVYAILGNHDYGDYMTWDSPADKSRNMEVLYDAFSRTGMDLLRNETRWLHKGIDSVALIGVENIGDPPFPIYGSLAKAYPDLSDNATKILLTHNPAHWVDSISGHDELHVPLTLSGHTHAMQIEIGGVSPAALRYSTWGGLYGDEHDRHQLYVNIGAGTVGMPMRLGATPEITVITLRRRR